MQHDFAPVDVIFLVRRGMDKLSPKDQTDLMSGAWKKLHKKLRITS